jgi:hypothetical protein
MRAMSSKPCAWNPPPVLPLTAIEYAGYSILHASRKWGEGWRVTPSTKLCSSFCRVEGGLPCSRHDVCVLRLPPGFPAVPPYLRPTSVVPPTLTGRVENWRAHLRWRVSSRALAIARWVHSSTIVTFPAPATSNATCGFPALRFPVRFRSRVMRPLVLGVRSAVAGIPGSR